MDRKEYWNNNYPEYWKKRVEEANQNKKISTLVQGDIVADSDKGYLDAINFLSPKKNDTILEMGCGFGRSLPFLYKISKNITAIDISEKMIEEVKNNYSKLKGIHYFACEAEKVPVASNSFSYIVCFAVFDALYQDLALLEMNRLLKKDGKVLISGKNDNYHDDDDLAYVAEVNARNKHHPNYFTNIDLLLSGGIEKFGFEIEEIRYFEKRGDTKHNQYLKKKPEYFYEYIMVLKKIMNTKNIKFKISDKYSKTYYRKAI